MYKRTIDTVHYLPWLRNGQAYTKQWLILNHVHDGWEDQWSSWTEVAWYEQEPTTECLYHAVEDAQDIALLRWVQKSQIHSPVLTNRLY